MRLRSVAALRLALVVLLLTACGEQGPPTAGEAREFDVVCDKANEGKRVAVDGYLRFPSSFTDSTSVVLRLYKAADFKSEPVGVQTTMGNQANQVEKPPLKFTSNDLKVHTADGQLARHGTKVRVSGKVYFPLVGQEFKCALENPLVELAK